MTDFWIVFSCVVAIGLSIYDNIKDSSVKGSSQPANETDSNDSDDIGGYSPIEANMHAGYIGIFSDDDSSHWDSSDDD